MGMLVDMILSIPKYSAGRNHRVTGDGKPRVCSKAAAAAIDR